MPGPFALVRHAHAGDPSQWDGDDRLRPLSEKGRDQANGLVAVLAVFQPTRIMSSPFDRCVQTVEPLARHLGLEVEVTDALAERREDEAIALVRQLAEAGIVASTHGDIVPAVLDDLARRDGVELGPTPKWSKASTWLLTGADGRFIDARYLPPPELA